MSLSHIDLEESKEKDLSQHHEHVHEHITHEANKAVLAQAIAAEDQEHMGVWQALKMFPKAIFWSFMVSFVIIMEAYDNALVGNLMAQPAFQMQFGEPVGDGTYQVPAAWQSACNYASTIGAFIGIITCGYVQPHLGYKKTMLGSLVLMVAVIFVPFFATTLPVLFIGELLCGFPWGFYNAIAQAYASEIAPLPLRGIFTMYNQSCWCTGQLVTAGILYAFRNGTDKVSPVIYLWSHGHPDMLASGLTRSLSRSNGSGPSLSLPFSPLLPSLPGGSSVRASLRKLGGSFNASKPRVPTATPPTSSL
jgi:SP family general alpha glucoside:H+ symporter-like MFS transporter